MTESTDPKSRAAEARRAREQRIQTVRMRVLAIAVAIFLLAWLGIYVRLISGHDPALANGLQPVVAQTADPQAAAETPAGDVTTAQS